MAIEFTAAPANVASEALGQLGRAPIQDLDNEDDPVCVQAKQYFGSVLHTLLREHDWNFASEFAELAVNGTAPITEYAYAYALPANCYMVRELNPSGGWYSTNGPLWRWSGYRAKWKIQGRNLLTDDSPAIIRYTRWSDIPNEWDGSFYQALVTLLAVRLAPALNVDKEKASDLYRLHQMQLADAKAIDGQEQSQERFNSTELTDDIRE